MPVLYTYFNYKTTGRRWIRPTQGEIDGTSRREVDHISVEVLLPDMAPYKESNAADFDTLGRGKRLRIDISRPRINWPYYFNNAFKRLIPLPASSVAPNMLRYRDPKSQFSDVYFSDVNPEKKITKMRCVDPQNTPFPPPPPNPICKVNTIYRDKLAIIYTFSLEYLPQWKEIDQKARALLGSLITSADTPTN